MRRLVFILAIALMGVNGFGQQSEVVKMSDLELVKLAKLPKLTLPASHSFKSLPTTKDNSASPYFPYVFNQSGWSCNQASSVGYLFTYEMNAIRDVSASSLANLYPPSFVWNFLNGGSGDNGVSYFDSWEVIRTNGIPSYEVYGAYPGPTRWISGYSEYYEGMKNRIDELFSIDVGNPEGLNTLKHWINDHMDGSPNGGVANFQIGSGGMKAVQIPEGLYEAGRYVMTRFNPIVGHAMTFVGWNDSVRHDFNEDGLYTNNIDINDDGIVDMKDWEIGAMLTINSWGENWPAEFERGRVYVPYRMLAMNSDEGGIWESSVTVMRPKKEYSPKLTIKASVTHTKRNQIKIIAGVAQNFAAAEPDMVLEFPFFNFQGGGLPMGGVVEPGGESLEFGLDITPLLNHINPNLPAKFFLEVYHQEGEEPNGSGKVDFMSVMDYSGNTVVEEACPDTDVAIRLRDVVRLSVIYDPIASPVEVATSSIPDAEVGEGYSTMLQAGGGTPPYKWSNMTNEYVAEQINEQWDIPFAEKILGISDTSRLVVDLDFDFNFYGKTYNQLVILKNGGIIMGSEPKDYPYVVDPSMYIFQNAGIFPFFTELQYLFGTDGVYRTDDFEGTTFYWDATLARAGDVFDPKFGVTLFRDGRIETGYYTTSIKSNWNWIAGVSAGDMKNFTLPDINDDPIFYGGTKINYTLNNWPSWLYFSEGGALLGIPVDGVSRVFLPVKVTDNAGLYSKKTFNLHIHGTSGVDGISTQTGIDVFPNPFNDRIQLKLKNINAERLQFDLYSIDGKIAYSTELQNTSEHINLDLSELEGKGNFFYQIRAGEELYQGKVVRVK